MAKDHTVQAGDCIHSIAFERGFFWETVWNHPRNADLKRQRTNPNILLPGDIVYVPDKQKKLEDGATEQRHRFKLKGVPAVLILRVQRPKVKQEPPASQEEAQEPAEEADRVTINEPAEEDEETEAAANVDCLVEIDGAISRTKTDGEGKLRITIPPNARRGKLRVEPGTPREQEITLVLGGLDPVDTLIGVAQRLHNLGFCGYGGDAEPTEASLIEPLQNFQKANGLEPSGQINDATKAKLKQMHGS